MRKKKMVKNKPKRLDRARSWRVARRKLKQKRLLTGNPRNRKPRPKHKGRDLVEVFPRDDSSKDDSAEPKVAPKKVAKKVEKKAEVKEVIEEKTSEIEVEKE